MHCYSRWCIACFMFLDDFFTRSILSAIRAPTFYPTSKSQTNLSVSAWNQLTFMPLSFHLTLSCTTRATSQKHTPYKIHIKCHANLPVKNTPWQRETEPDVLHAQTKHNVNDDFVQRIWRGSVWSATQWFEVQRSLPSGPIYSCFSHWGISVLTPNTAPVGTVVIFSGVVSLLTQSVTIHWRRHKSTKQYFFILIHD